MFAQDVASFLFDRNPIRDAPIGKVCVYCGSSPGSRALYQDAAVELGAGLAQSGFELVYGGGTEGLMGSVARAVLAHGGLVTGIIPHFLAERTLMLEGEHRLLRVHDMHTRKLQMFNAADAFVALPGGLGTLEELVEQLTWLKLDRHQKPVIVADIGGFWNPLLRLFDHMGTEGFLRSDCRGSFTVCQTISQVLAALVELTTTRSGDSRSSVVQSDEPDPSVGHPLRPPSESSALVERSPESFSCIAPPQRRASDREQRSRSQVEP